MATFHNLFITLSLFHLSSSDTTNNDCETDLISWIRRNGGEISDSIEIKSSNIRTRGVYSVTTLHSNDVLASIPISLLFTLTDAQKLLKTVLPQNNKDALSNLGPIDTLSLALFIEYHNQDSFWNSYLQCLPTVTQLKTELQMPLYWTESEINQYLQTSKVGTFIQRRIKSITESFQEINAVLQNVSYLKDVFEFTKDKWIWALSIAWSRSFSVMIDHKKVKCLVPFGDFFNFNNDFNELNVNPSNWNQSAFARDLMKYDVKSYTSKDGEQFVFKLKDIEDRQFESGMQLFAEYSAEVLPNFVVFLDYGFCIKDNPVDGIWITIEDILKSLKFYDKFTNNKIKPKSQKLMKELVEGLQLGQIFVLRSMISEYYLDKSDIAFANQKNFIEPYAFSLFLMSLVLNAKNDILRFGDELLNFKKLYPQIRTNHDITAVLVHLLNKAFKSEKKTTKLVKNTWSALNNFVKSAMAQFETSLIQDLMLREELMNGEDVIDMKLDCGLNIRINDKRVLFTVWVQLQRLKSLLLSLIKQPLTS